MCIRDRHNSESEYYSYSYSAKYLCTNIIRIRIRSFRKNEYYLYSYSVKILIPNNIRIRIRSKKQYSLTSDSSASVVALTAFVRHLPHVRPHLYLKTWCVYAREALVTFVCLRTSMCHLVFLQLMYVFVCKSYHIGQTLSNT